MEPSDDFRRDAFGGSATYEIVVEGLIPLTWGERLAGMLVRTNPGTNGEASHSVLVGPLRDQSELNAVLDVLYNLHLPLIRVEKLADRST